ncbi:hypothetical protein BTE77_34775 [Ensifer adhaerens]|nr:hypothetical protein BTE77_34775 [Ensifer adhaerens]
MDIKASMQGAHADAIVVGTLASGSKLAEPEISRLYGVSRIVTCEVLLWLRCAALVDLKTNCGAAVAAPSREEAEARLHLASLTAADIAAAAAAGPDEIRQRAAAACEALAPRLRRDQHERTIALYLDLIGSMADTAAWPALAGQAHIAVGAAQLAMRANSCNAALEVLAVELGQAIERGCRESAAASVQHSYQAAGRIRRHVVYLDQRERPPLEQILGFALANATIPRSTTR